MYSSTYVSGISNGYEEGYDACLAKFEGAEDARDMF